MKNSWGEALRYMGKSLCDPRLHVGFMKQTKNSLAGILKTPKNNFDHGNNASTVILTPGIFCGPGAMSELGEQLNEKCNVVYTPNLSWLNTGNMKKGSLSLGEIIADVLQTQEKNGDVNLVGHSLGGLMTIEALVRTEGIKANKVFVCATPFSGTPMAKRASWCEAARQVNEQGGYLHSYEHIDNVMDDLVVNISLADVFVPHAKQLPHDTLLEGEYRKQEYEGYIHTDFIVGEKMHAFAHNTLEIIGGEK